MLLVCPAARLKVLGKTKLSGHKVSEERVFVFSRLRFEVSKSLCEG